MLYLLQFHSASKAAGILLTNLQLFLLLFLLLFFLLFLLLFLLLFFSYSSLSYLSPPTPFLNKLTNIRRLIKQTRKESKIRFDPYTTAPLILYMLQDKVGR